MPTPTSLDDISKDIARYTQKVESLELQLKALDSDRTVLRLTDPEIERERAVLTKEKESLERQIEALKRAQLTLWIENPNDLHRNRSQYNLGPIRRVLADAIYEVLLEEGPLTRQMILSRVVARGVQLKAMNPVNQVSAMLTADPRFGKVKGQRNFWNLTKICRNDLTDSIELRQEVYTQNKETADVGASTASSKTEVESEMLTTELTTENSTNPSAPAPANPPTVTASIVTVLGEGEPDDGDEGRRSRGMAIAALGLVEKTRVGYRVRSQSANPEHPWYAVRLDGADGPACECDDFELRGLNCKHIYAVQFYLLWAENPAESPNWTPQEKRELETETVAKKPTRNRGWAKFNRKQVNEKPMFVKILSSLCDTIPEPPQGMGRRRIPLSERIFSMAMKVYTTKCTRRSMGDLQDAVRDGWLVKAPDFSSITRWMESPELTPLLVDLIERSALPFAQMEDLEERCFAADSTGFTAIPYHRWFDYKWGRPAKRGQYVKVHITCGVKSKIITAAVVTPGESSDARQMPGMVKTTARNFSIDEYSGDAGYVSRENLKVVDEVGGTAFIPYKTNSVPRNKRHKQDAKMDLWERMYYYFHSQRQDWLEHYHQRSNVESCIWMVKSKLGSYVRSKTPVARVNEAYVKLLCHNLIIVGNAMLDCENSPTFVEEVEDLPMAA